MTSNVSDLVKNIMGSIEDIMIEAEVDYPAGREAGPSISYDCEAIEARILAALTPAEQCFSVKEGCVVQAYERREVLALSGSTKQGLCGCPLSEALTIRSAEDVRREALEEAAMVATCDGNDFTATLIQSLIDTPAPSTDKTPTVAEAADRDFALSDFEPSETQEPAPIDEECPRCCGYEFGCYECNPQLVAASLRAIGEAK